MRMMASCKWLTMATNTLGLLLGVIGATINVDSNSAAEPAAGLMLSVFNNTALAGAPVAQRVVPNLTFTLPLVAAPAVPLSVSLTGTMAAEAGRNYSFSCSFGAAQFATLHVDDHLVCQFGANSDSILTPGQGSIPGCGGGSDHSSCAGVDNPLPTMSRTELPVRMQVLYNPSLLPSSAPYPTELAVSVDLTPAAAFTSSLPRNEQRRREMQLSLLQGWGLFYDMSYTDIVLLPHGARIKLALCEIGAGGQCLTEARMDWPDKTGLAGQLRPGTHAYDRSYTQMYVSAGGCNVSLTTGGGSDLHVLIETVTSPDENIAAQPTCGAYLSNTDFPGHDLMKVQHVASRDACCALCANNTQCSAGSWDGPNSKYAKSATCNLKTAAPQSDRRRQPGMDAFVLRPPSGPPPPRSCKDMALVVVGLTTWFRSNDATVEASKLRFNSAGLGQTMVHSTQLADGNLTLNHSIVAQPHLSFRLGPGFSLGLNDGRTAKSLTKIRATLAAARQKEDSRYTHYGDLAETKRAVQSAVMWQFIANPIEQGPFAPVIRGNPWGLDKGVVNDDWPYDIELKQQVPERFVIFDWDNHFGAYMLSLDAKEEGYSALIQVVKAKTGEGFVPNTAASVNKARHSQPPVGSKILLEMYKKYNESWIVELLFDDLYDWNSERCPKSSIVFAGNSWFVRARTLAPLGIICLGSEEGSMQDARFESGLDNSPMYDAGSCDKTKGAAGMCGAWNCSSTGACDDFKDGKMQLYDVGMASMHTMDSFALAQLARAIGRTEEATKLEQRAETMTALIEEHLWNEASGIYVNKIPDGRWNHHIAPTSFYAMQTNGSTDTRVERMVKDWLMNSTHFAITPNGDHVGNNDANWWGLPSIEQQDPAFRSLGYWRGYVWGPMAQLTYWGLQNYAHVPAAATAKAALCKQMNGMMLEQWRNHGYICENYFPANGHDGCSPGAMHFYHWGALSGFISLVDAGFY